MVEPHYPIFEAAEALRYVRDSRKQLARFKSEVIQVVESIQPTIVEAQKLIAAAKVVLGKPV